MEITIYRRHSAGCKHQDDGYHPRCGCSLWFQFNWSGPNSTLDGNKLHRGQNKWSAETRIWSVAQTNKKRLDSELTALLEGKPVRQNVTVQVAVEERLKFKERNGLGITKAKLMGGKLVEWCKNNDVLLLTALTSERAMRFRTSLLYRTGDSGSLSVHWSVINGFFGWAVGMGYIEKNPSPDIRIFLQFRIKHQQREVVPPTKQEMEKVLAAATGSVRTCNQIMTGRQTAA